MKRKLPIITLLIISIVFIFLFYGKIIQNPNKYVFANDGDGIKNYFTYCYHIKHDTSFVNFQGMNYPYGEHYLYTDCHPVLTNLFKAISNISDFFVNNSIGILNLLMILSIFLTFWLVYYLLREFEINKWICVLFSVSITMLSPQIFRLGGHLALSYSVAIPLSWLLMLRIFKFGRNIKLIIFLFLNNLFWMFIHAYLGVIVIGFEFFILLFYFLFDKTRKSKMLNYLSITLSIILPILIFNIFLSTTDTHTDRTDNPSSFFLNNAEFDDVFLPNQPPLKPFIEKLIHSEIKQKWEAWSYVGIATTLLFLVVVISLIVASIRRKKNKIVEISFQSKLMNISLLSSIILLLFAMAIPFRQFPELLDFLSIFKQFRGTGRFTWPFYFVITVFTAYSMHYYINSAKNSVKRIVLIVVTIIMGCFSIFEAIPYHVNSSKSITTSLNPFEIKYLNENYVNAIQSINPNDYQAIITLPFYYYGSESFARFRVEPTARASFIFSYHTGIPIINANLTRTSVAESKNIVQIVTPNFYNKPIIGDFKSSKPFIILRTNDSITKYEKLILNKAKAIFISDEISLFAISKEKLFENHSIEVINDYKLKKEKLYRNLNFECTTDSSYIFYNNFDNNKASITYRGKGAYASVKKGDNVFAEFNGNTFKSNKQYDVSLWMYNGLKDALNLWFRFIIDEYDENNNLINQTVIFPEHAETIDGNWSLVEGIYTVSNAKHRIKIYSVGKKDSKAELFADDLLIKESENNIYRLDSNELFFNNHKIRF